MRYILLIDIIIDNDEKTRLQLGQVYDTFIQAFDAFNKYRVIERNHQSSEYNQSIFGVRCFIEYTHSIMKVQ